MQRSVRAGENGIAMLLHSVQGLFCLGGDVDVILMSQKKVRSQKEPAWWRASLCRLAGTMAKRIGAEQRTRILMELSLPLHLFNIIMPQEEHP